MYAHVVLDVSAEALPHLERVARAAREVMARAGVAASILIEMENFANQLRAEQQHLMEEARAHAEPHAQIQGTPGHEGD